MSNDIKSEIGNTLEKFLSLIQNNEDAKQAFSKCETVEQVQQLMEKHGIPADKDVVAYTLANIIHFNSQSKNDELSDKEMENVSGGIILTSLYLLGGAAWTAGAVTATAAGAACIGRGVYEDLKKWKIL